MRISDTGGFGAALDGGIVAIDDMTADTEVEELVGYHLWSFDRLLPAAKTATPTRELYVAVREMRDRLMASTAKSYDETCRWLTETDRTDMVPLREDFDRQQQEARRQADALHATIPRLEREEQLRTHPWMRTAEQLGSPRETAQLARRQRERETGRAAVPKGKKRVKKRKGPR
jgi:hypothetical protein